MYPTFAPEPLGTPTQHHVAWADEILLPLTFIADRPVTFIADRPMTYIADVYSCAAYDRPMTFIADRPMTFIADRPMTFIAVLLTTGP